MPDAFEEIRKQIHEIRNFIWPLELKLDGIESQIAKGRASFETKTSEIDARISEQDAAIALLSEHIAEIRLFLKMPPNEVKQNATPVREDKLNPAILPPQTPQ
jgi:hypothetical protein